MCLVNIHKEKKKNQLKTVKHQSFTISQSWKEKQNHKQKGKMRAISDFKRKEKERDKQGREKKKGKKGESLKNLRHGLGGVRKWSTL